MSFIARLARQRPGEPFDPCHDSRIATNPEYADSTTPPEPPLCAVCSSQLTFLIQLGTPYRDTHVRTLYVYFCPAHSEQSEGWRVFRYTVAKQVVQVQKQSAFDEMNSLSSWVDDLQLFPTGPGGGKQKGASRAARSADDDNEAYRVLVEEDFLTPLSFPVGGPEASRLFEAYKQRDPADVDEEDHMDLDAIRQTTSAVDSQEPDSEASSDESDEVQADPMLLEFQYYVTMRPHAVLRYQWNGKPLLLHASFTFNRRCNRCGAECAFEFQLLPALVQHIGRKLTRRAAMHIASVLLYTCRSDCAGQHDLQAETTAKPGRPDSRNTRR